MRKESKKQRNERGERENKERQGGGKEWRKGIRITKRDRKRRGEKR